MDASRHPEAEYQARAGRHREAAGAAADRARRLGTARVWTFLAVAAAGLAYDVLEGGGETLALVAAAVLAAVFVVEVVLHRRARRAQAWDAALAQVAEEGLLRLHRNWDGLQALLPERERDESAPVPADHPYARDLDVVGPASLVRLAGPVTSEVGRTVLRRWLLTTQAPEESARRQAAVAELAPLVDLRHAFTARGRLDGPDRFGGLGEVLAWAEAEPWLLGRHALRLAAWIVPAVLTLFIVGDVWRGWGPWWLIPGAVQLEMLRRVTPRLRTEFTMAEHGASALRAYRSQFELVETQSWEAERLQALAHRWKGGGDGALASQAVERFSRLLETVEGRGNAFWAAAALLFMADVHLGVRLDRWRRAHGPVLRSWIDALGEWEALAALSAVAYDHPDWAFPEFMGDSAPSLDAEALGHPLLSPAECVRNDVRVGPPGTFLLVTGSNMSGKSTLLRALGANAVLAGAGAPVCARAFRLPPLRVHTSMRIDDSLARGVSLFMAELLRVKDIVEAATGAGPDAPPVLYLLDEILHGTNTAERRVAARGVIRHLLAQGAIGAVSTHDLTLADAADLRAAANAVHFRERVEQSEAGTRLHFDYTLREGIATTRNALKLLEAVGLGELDVEEEG